MRPTMSSVRVNRQGWDADYERVDPSSGAVVVLADLLGAATYARELCAVLHERGLSTLRIDAAGASGLQPATTRLIGALEWLHDDRGGVSPGLFGCGRGAVVALHAAARRPGCVAALVVQGGVPDRMIAQLPRVQAATLLVIGDADAGLAQAQRRVLPLFGGARRLEVVPGAGACGGSGAANQAVAHLAAEWFAHQLPSRPLH